MIDTLSTPWDFHNNDKKVFSPDGQQKLVYYDLNEIGMGAPIGGECRLETADKKTIKILDWCGGPPVWETSGSLVAIPIWTRDFGTVQKLGVIDTKKKELKIFSRTFRVLDLRTFDRNVVSGYDSPAHKTTTLTFDIEKEHIEKIIRLDK